MSNIRPSDYAGAQTWAKCHEDNYALWCEHPHRRRNAEATDETVLGDFSGSPTAHIPYRGGVARFYREGENSFVKLARKGTERVFQILLLNWASSIARHPPEINSTILTSSTTNLRQFRTHLSRGDCMVTPGHTIPPRRRTNKMPRLLPAFLLASQNAET